MFHGGEATMRSQGGGIAIVIAGIAREIVESCFQMVETSTCRDSSLYRLTRVIPLGAVRRKNWPSRPKIEARATMVLYQDSILNELFERGSYLCLKSRLSVDQNFRRRIRLGQSTPN
jgi:hypothetical protein